MPSRAAKPGRKGEKTMKDLISSAIALYDGGWRAIDKELFKKEYEMTEDEATEICEILAEIEKGNA